MYTKTFLMWSSTLYKYLGMQLHDLASDHMDSFIIITIENNPVLAYVYSTKNIQWRELKGLFKQQHNSQFNTCRSYIKSNRNYVKEPIIHYDFSSVCIINGHYRQHF